MIKNIRANPQEYLAAADAADEDIAKEIKKMQELKKHVLYTWVNYHRINPDDVKPVSGQSKRLEEPLLISLKPGVSLLRSYYKYQVN
jgi:hypothetical protein